MAETEKKGAAPAYVRVLWNLLPDKTGAQHQAGQIVAEGAFANLDALLADGKVEPVAAEAVIAADADPRDPVVAAQLKALAAAEPPLRCVSAPAAPPQE